MLISTVAYAAAAGRRQRNHGVGDGPRADLGDLLERLEGPLVPGRVLVATVDDSLEALECVVELVLLEMACGGFFFIFGREKSESFFGRRRFFSSFLSPIGKKKKTRSPNTFFFFILPFEL